MYMWNLIVTLFIKRVGSRDCHKELIKGLEVATMFFKVSINNVTQSLANNMM